MRYFNELVGHTITDIYDSDDFLRMQLEDGTICELYHEQDCCEQVSIESINGELKDLIGSPIIVATEEVTDENPPDIDLKNYPWQESYTWTTYTLGTAEHTSVIRWYGESNGYYSEDVYFRVVPPPKVKPDTFQ